MKLPNYVRCKLSLKWGIITEHDIFFHLHRLNEVKFFNSVNGEINDSIWSTPFAIVIHFLSWTNKFFIYLYTKK